MDAMGGLYIPLSCRDNFFIMAIKRTWRYIVFKLNDEDPEFVEIEKCGERDGTISDLQ